jgi:predicted MFS family arabinose efflux permease
LAGRLSERRLVLIVGAVVFIDTTFYAVIAPLLPTLTHELHLSKLSAGVMTASYAVGVLAGSVPGGVLAARAGPKSAVMTGLGLLAASTIAFAFLRSAVALDAARLLEGIGGACSWSGGMAWIMVETAPGRRGAVMGRTIGAAIVGSLFGPVIGALATAIGRPAAFSVVVVGALALLAQTLRLPAQRAPSSQGVAHLLSALRSPRVAVGVWLVTLPATASGAINVLAPLRLHRFGAGAAAIGATFVIAAAIEAVVVPATGHLSDRRGRLVPLRIGLVATAALLLCFDLPGDALALAVLVVAIVSALGVFWAPAMAMLSEAAEGHGLDQGLAAALMNIAWAAGQIAGSGVGGAIAKVAGDILPMAIAAVLCLATLAAISRRCVAHP